MKKIITAVFVMLCCIASHAETQGENAPATKVLELLDGYVIIHNKTNEPLELPGSVLMVENEGKANQREYFVKINSTGENAKAIPKNEIIYESIIDRGFAAKIDVLSFASGQMSADDKAQVLIENVYSATALHYSAAGVKEKAIAIAKDGKESRPTATFYYVQSVLYTTIKHKIFNKKTFGAGFTGYGVGVKGDIYTTTSLFTLTPVVSVNVWPIAIPSQPAPPVKPTLIEIKNLNKLESLK